MYFTFRMYYLSSVRILHKAGSARWDLVHKSLNYNLLKEWVLISEIIAHAVAGILPLSECPELYSHGDETLS
jgi:hypothetical protein